MDEEGLGVEPCGDVLQAKVAHLLPQLALASPPTITHEHKVRVSMPKIVLKFIIFGVLTASFPCDCLPIPLRRGLLFGDISHDWDSACTWLAL